MGLGRRSRYVIAAAVTALLVTTSFAAPASATSDRRSSKQQGSQWGVAEEQAFVAKINQLRTGLGLAPLAVDGELTTQARIWSQTMKDRGDIFHSSNLAGGISANWQKLGENVGVGGTVDALFDAFVASPHHYENLVDPSYRFIGVGVVWDGDRMFTAHRFMATFPDPPATTAAPAKAPAAPAAGAATAPDELAATDPPPDTAPAPTTTVPPTPVAPPAAPTQVALVLRTLGDLLD
ncbi:MAG: CAP domain-containing protein [Acidimicrobiales bacterium]